MERMDGPDFLGLRLSHLSTGEEVVISTIGDPSLEEMLERVRHAMVTLNVLIEFPYAPVRP